MLVRANSAGGNQGERGFDLRLLGSGCGWAAVMSWGSVLVLQGLAGKWMFVLEEFLPLRLRCIQRLNY